MSTPPFDDGPKRREAGDHQALQPAAIGPRRRGLRREWSQRAVSAGFSRLAVAGPVGGGGPLRRVLVPVLGVLVVLGLCGAAWTVPQVRSVLRDSFTERQQAYIELYFGREPFFDGDELVVPLKLVEHGDTGGRHAVRTWAQDAKGRQLAVMTETVTTKPGALLGVDVRLRLKKGAKRHANLVQVALPGHAQRLRMHLH
ncbi:hypothetical protein ACIRVK_36530 [Streptomyces sp. NPDC101152]|uniref:hypothetical protein n=1 Tax=Streptomyces sp. NPDC101152 TaxID=3366116 RepID=UPI003804C74F